MEEGRWLPPVWLRPEPDEPLHGILLRLCELNGLPRMNNLEVASGIRAKRVRGGEQTDEVARMLRCDATSLEANVWKRDSTNYRSWNGIPVSIISDADFVHRRVCPDCLSENPYHRFHWDVSTIASCPRHDRLLVHTCSCGERLSWRDGAFAKCRICEDGSVHALPPERPDPDAAAFDTYLLGRLGAVPETLVPALDRMPIRQACDVVGRIGVLDVLGYRPRWTEVSDVDMPAACVRGRGFSILRDARLEETLERVFCEFDTDHRASLPNSSHRPRIDDAYGWFVRWFRHRGGEVLSPEIAAAIVRHASTKFMIAADTFPATERSGQTVNLVQAKQISQTSAATLRTLLVREGFLPAQLKKGSPLRIERQVVERIAKDLANSLTQVDLVRLTGLRVTSVEQLCITDAIPCWIRGGGRDFHRYRFKRSDVDPWISDHLDGATVVEALDETWTPLCDYAAVRGIPTEEMLRRARTGELILASLHATGRSFANTFVTGERSESEGEGVVSASFARQKIGLPRPDIEKLVTAGMLQVGYSSDCFTREGRLFLTRRSVDELCAAVASVARPWNAGKDHRKRSEIRLTKAVARWSGQLCWSRVLNAITNGNLKVLRDPSSGASLVATLFVEDTATIDALVETEHGKAPNRRLSLHEAAIEIGTSRDALTAFRKAGLIGGSLEHLGFNRLDVDRFREQYVLPTEIAERTGIALFVLPKRLLEAGISPVFEKTIAAKRRRMMVFDRAATDRFIGAGG